MLTDLVLFQSGPNPDARRWQWYRCVGGFVVEWRPEWRWRWWSMEQISVLLLLLVSMYSLPCRNTKRDFPHHTIFKMYFRCSAPKLNTVCPNRGNGWQHFTLCFEVYALRREIEHEWGVCAHGRSRNNKAVATSCPYVSFRLLWLVVVVGSFLSELGRSNPIKTRGMTRINIWLMWLWFIWFRSSNCTLRVSLSHWYDIIRYHHTIYY